MTNNNFKPDVKKIENTPTIELWSLFQIADKMHPVTLLGDDGIKFHNVKAIMWKELTKRFNEYMPKQ